MADSSPRIRKNPLKEPTADKKYADATAKLLLAKAEKETALAKAAQLELALAEKHLIVREDAEKIIFETSRTLRDKILSLCTKISPKLSTISSPPEIQKVLKKEFSDLLRNFIDENKERIENIKT
jgi:hypothetical protein